jgi:hypothetical protein
VSRSITFSPFDTRRLDSGKPFSGYIILGMPALLIHLTVARETLDRARGAAELRELVDAAGASPASFLLGAIFVDLPYHARFAGQLARHLAGRAYALSEWGDVLHTRATGRLALALLAHRARSHLGRDAAAQVLALAAGYLSHHALDRVVHPVVNQLVRRALAPGEPPSRLHSRIERYQNIFYHLGRVGHDIAGSPHPRRLVAEVEGVRLLRPALSRVSGDALRAALLETHGRAPAAAELGDWLFGIAAYGLLMSSPLGRRERLSGDLEALRRDFYQGPAVDMVAPLERGVQLTLEYWRAALELLRADHLGGEARAVFLRQVPDVDLGTGF